MLTSNNQDSDHSDTEVNFTLSNYVRNSKHFVQQSHIAKGADGFFDIFTKHKFGQKVKTAYKICLLIYYLVHSLYRIIVFAIERQHLAYNIVCGIFSFVGLMYEAVPQVIHKIKQYNKERQRSCQISPTDSNMPAENDNNTMHIEDIENDTSQDHMSQVNTSDGTLNETSYAKKIFKEFLVDSLGEILIYPLIICALYGFINERRWQFDSAIAVFDSILLFYSLAMDAVYTKINYIWLLQKVIRSSYKAYDELESTNTNTCFKLFSPFSLIIPFGIMLVLTHWFMLAIIGVRIYADNFSREIDGNGNFSSEPETGDYETTPYTRFMIFCGAYLPVISVIVYILLNKYWFLQIFWTIKDEDASAENNIKEMPTSVKLLAFLVDLKAYVAVIFLMIPFIFFALGTFLYDYQTSDFELVSSARNAAIGFGGGFIFLFVLSNIQAILVSISLIIIVVIMLLYKATVLLCDHDEEWWTTQHQQNIVNR